MLVFSSMVERLKMAKKRLADYVQVMQTDDVLAATDKAKVQARTLLEDQGITILALLLADFLADTIWAGQDRATRQCARQSFRAVMKVYLDTTVITLLMFGARTNPDRHGEVVDFFAALDAGRMRAFVSIYALQELCAFCYDNFPAEDAPHVACLAFHELLGHELMLVPLLSRADRIVLNRRFPMRDTSDQAHAATAYRAGCEAIITYDQHYQDIADRFTCLTAAELLNKLAKDDE